MCRPAAKVSVEVVRRWIVRGPAEKPAGGSLARRGLVNVLPLVCAAMIGAATMIGAVPVLAQGYTVAKTPEGVHRKAVVTIDDAKLFSASGGDDGTALDLMDVFFILEGGTGDRVPVTREPDKVKPIGWLETAAFIEWNSVQMIDFAPQGGRKLVNVYDQANCAIDFARSGRATCEAIGREPDRQTKDVDYKILIPVFDSRAEKSSVVYEGGFVRVTPGQNVKAIDPTNLPSSEEPATPKFAGFELVLAIDSTISMQEWFKPTVEAVADFVSKIKGELADGEVRESLRIGLLFFQDRKTGDECELDYITQWRVSLTESSGTDTIDETIAALPKEQAAQCGSDEREEAVYDAVNRAVLDPKWKDGTFRVVALIGDSPPHLASNEVKNPLRLDESQIQKLADERNVRFLNLMIMEDSNQDVSSFENLALRRGQELLGRFSRVPGNPSEMRKNLGQILAAEWDEIVKPTRELLAAGVTQQSFSSDQSVRKKYNVSDYAYPIILNLLPVANESEDAKQNFAKGWVPQKINSKIAVGEYIFIRRSRVRGLMALVESIVAGAEDGESDGADAFVETLRQSLAVQVKLRPDEIFAPGESLSSMLKKAKVLPFDTGILRFTAEEINQWRPEDFEQLRTVLDERLTTLREFSQVAGNLRSFGGVKYFYVPRVLFP